MKHIFKTLGIVLVDMLILLFIFFFCLVSNLPTDTLTDNLIFGIFMLTGCVFVIEFILFKNRYGEPYRNETFGDEIINTHADVNAHVEKKSYTSCTHNGNVRYRCTHPGGNCIDQEDADKRCEPKK